MPPGNRYFGSLDTKSFRISAPLLNLAIVLGIIVIIIRDVVFNAFGASGIPISAVLTTLQNLVSNKKARKHVFLLRLRQRIDVFSIGGNNTVHPVVSIALVRVRDQMDESAPRHNAAQIYMV